MISVSLETFQVPRQRLKTIVVRVHALRVNRKRPAQVEAPTFIFQRREPDRVVRIQLRKHVRRRKHGHLRIFFDPRRLTPRPAGQILVLHLCQAFQKTRRLVKVERALPWGKIIQEGNAFPFLPRVFLRRINDDGLQVLYRTLALHLERTDGVNLVPPQLDSHGHLPGQGEHVQQSAPHGELPGTFHLLLPHVADGGKFLLEPCKIHRPSRFQGNPLLHDFRQRLQPVQKRVHRRDHDDFRQFQQRPHHFHPLAFQVVPLDVGMVKKQVPGRVIERVFLQKARLLQRLFGLLVPRVNDKAARPPVAQRACQMCLLGADTTRDL